MFKRYEYQIYTIILLTIVIFGGGLLARISWTNEFDVEKGCFTNQPVYQHIILFDTSDPYDENVGLAIEKK